MLGKAVKKPGTFLSWPGLSQPSRSDERRVLCIEITGTRPVMTAWDGQGMLF